MSRETPSLFFQETFTAAETWQNHCMHERSWPEGSAGHVKRLWVMNAKPRSQSDRSLFRCYQTKEQHRAAKLP